MTGTFNAMQVLPAVLQAELAEFRYYERDVVGMWQNFQLFVAENPGLKKAEVLQRFLDARGSCHNRGLLLRTLRILRLEFEKLGAGTLQAA